MKQLDEFELEVINNRPKAPNPLEEVRVTIDAINDYIDSMLEETGGCYHGFTNCEDCPECFYED